MDTLPICQAKSKRSGKRCGNFAVKNKNVCHIHGGLSTGAKTVEGQRRQITGNWKHGRRSQEASAERKQFRKMLKAYKEDLKEIFNNRG